MDYEKYLETIDISGVTDREYVSTYYGVALEYMRVHRKAIKDNKLNCAVKSIIGSDISDVLGFYDKELKLNSIYNIYLNRCLYILDDENYLDVYKLGRVTLYSYYHNVGYYNGRIRRFNLSRKGILYSSNYSEDYKEFDRFHNKKLMGIKVKKRW